MSGGPETRGGRIRTADLQNVSDGGRKTFRSAQGARCNGRCNEFAPGAPQAGSEAVAPGRGDARPGPAEGDPPQADADPAGALADAGADPELAELIRRWPSLPPAIRAGILALVRTAVTPTDPGAGR